MKLEPHLPQLPSIGELLEHPRVKGVVARINRSTLAQRATGFLDEWRSALVKQTGRVELPSVSDLAERLARRLLGEPSGEGALINATGLVIGDPRLAPPLADTAVQAMMQAASEYHGRQSPLATAVERLLCGLTGAEAAVVVSSYEGALTLALSTTSGGREAAVVGHAAGESGVDWQWLAARSGAVLRSVPNATAIGSAGGSSRLAAIVQTGADLVADLAPVVEAARSRHACVIDACGQAGLANPSRFGLQSVDTLGERIAAGADLVIADGAGLLGGPACGLVVGKREQVEAIRVHPLASLLSLGPLGVAALEATLSIYRDDPQDGVMFNVPVWQLLSAPVANLKQRAERLAPLMGASSNVSSAAPREVESAWRRDGARSFMSPSWAVVVHPKSGDARALVARLQQGPRPILAAEVDGGVQLDLRSVYPRWDQQLAAAIEG